MFHFCCSVCDCLLQLQSPVVQKITKILEMMDSSYYPTIKTLVQNVFDGKIKHLHILKCQLLYHNVNNKHFILNIFFPQSKALQEAQDIDLHLQPLNAHISQLEKAGFPHLETFVPALFHTLFLIWTNCQSYQRPACIVVLLQEFCNLLIEQVRTGHEGKFSFQTDFI